MQSRYPFDWQAVSKGDVLDEELLRKITGKIPGSDEFRFACMSLQGLIQDNMGFTVKLTSDHRLCVLTDMEAADHNRRLFGQFMRSMVSRHALNCEVDVEKLTPEERARHDRTILAQSRYVSAVVQTTKELTIARRSGERLP